MAVIPALRKLKQVCEFEASLGNRDLVSNTNKI
jgi:hypothetical protein